MQILSEGKIAKFTERVEHLTFSREYAVERGEKILYITERTMFKLDEKRLQLIEIAPVIELERDILAQMSFTPGIADPLQTMEASLFRN